MSLTIWLSCFLGMFAVDVCWVWYMDRANNDRAHPAAFWALCLHAFGAGNTLVYTDDPRYLSATLLGTYLGTWAVIRWKQRAKAREAAAAASKAALETAANAKATIARLDLLRIPLSPMVGEDLERAAQRRSFALGNLAASDSASSGAREWAKAELAKDDPEPGDTVPTGAKVVEDDGS